MMLNCLSCDNYDVIDKVISCKKNYSEIMIDFGKSCGGWKMKKQNRKSYVEPKNKDYHPESCRFCDHNKRIERGNICILTAMWIDNKNIVNGSKPPNWCVLGEMAGMFEI